MEGGIYLAARMDISLWGAFILQVDHRMIYPGRGATPVTANLPGAVSRTMLGEEQPGIGDGGVLDEVSDIRSVMAFGFAKVLGEVEVRVAVMVLGVEKVLGVGFELPSWPLGLQKFLAKLKSKRPSWSLRE